MQKHTHLYPLSIILSMIWNAETGKSPEAPRWASLVHAVVKHYKMLFGARWKGEDWQLKLLHLRWLRWISTCTWAHVCTHTHSPIQTHKHEIRFQSKAFCHLCGLSQSLFFIVSHRAWGLFHAFLLQFSLHGPKYKWVPNRNPTGFSSFYLWSTAISFAFGK